MQQLNPAVAAWMQDALANAEAPTGTSVPELRETWDRFVIGHHRHVRDAGPLHGVEDLTTPGGVPLRLYVPTDAAAGDRPRSLHVHLHGGGWWMGSTASVDPMCRELAVRLGMTVASVDYRLAPEAPWPAAPEDVYETLVWLSGSFDRISIGGESAGANIAAVVALMARDRNGPALVAQWLDVPAVDIRLPMTESVRLYGSGFGLEVAQLPMIVEWYAAGHADDPYVSPATADLVGLPPTIVTTAECDPLRDQGEAFAHALEAAGVTVECRRAPGHIHGSSWLTGLDADTARWHDEVVALLAQHHVQHDLELAP